MVRVKQQIIAILLIVLFSFQLSFSEKPENPAELYKYYKIHYNFYAIPDTVYTIEGEFIVPDGYHHPDQFDMTRYSDWVSHFPLWHQYKPVGNWKKQKEKEYTEISRAVHLPWVGTSFRDYAIPIRMLGEFYFQKDSLFRISIMPHGGEALTYNKWLENNVVFNHRGEVIMQPDVLKENNEREYYTFLNFCMEYSSYRGLANSCDSVGIEEVQPGDMFITMDKTGKKGTVHIILHTIFNDSGDRLYLVGTGCPTACDFHIPLTGSDRDNPWLTIKSIMNFQGDYESSGFYRFKELRE